MANIIFKLPNGKEIVTKSENIKRAIEMESSDCITLFQLLKEDNQIIDTTQWDSIKNVDLNYLEYVIHYINMFESESDVSNNFKSYLSQLQLADGLIDLIVISKQYLQLENLYNIVLEEFMITNESKDLISLSNLVQKVTCKSIDNKTLVLILIRMTDGIKNMCVDSEELMEELCSLYNTAIFFLINQVIKEEPFAFNKGYIEWLNIWNELIQKAQ